MEPKIRAIKRFYSTVKNKTKLKKRFKFKWNGMESNLFYFFNEINNHTKNLHFIFFEKKILSTNITNIFLVHFFHDQKNNKEKKYVLII